ncbi:MAG TPA: UDP-N-acetylmuramate dehydrogenase [Deltaproteobacteria bacterium]|nr:UDP-N-acetylmuramate dehydrogenase [Deltaproteobacteria bacterium]
MVSAQDITSMHCGGSVACIFEPEGPTELAGLLHEHPDLLVLGGGTNTIFGDDVFTRPVVRLGAEFAFVEEAPGGIRAGAATSMKRLVSYCIRTGLSGIEFMAGIPGTLGGALYMNAGTADNGIMDAVIEIELTDASGSRTLARDRIDCSYRSGGIPEGSVITAARLSLQGARYDEVRRNVLAFLARRKAQPRGFSAGSVFRNPQGHAAGKLIDQAGFKGRRIGGAKVSEIHANFIINDGHASTADVRELIRLVKQGVKERFGIELTEEVRIVGQ